MIKLDWHRIIKFTLTSGIGFILDFSFYFSMTQLIGIPVVCANFMSSIIGATFVFIVSTRRIFINSNSRLPLACKYILYILYQLLIITAASFLISRVNKLITLLVSISFIVKFSKLIAKALITPITLFCNYCFMKTISKH